MLDCQNCFNYACPNQGQSGHKYVPRDIQEQDACPQEKLGTILEEAYDDD